MAKQIITVVVEIAVDKGGPSVNATQVLGWFEAVVKGCQNEAPAPLYWSDFRLKSIDIPRC